MENKNVEEKNNNSNIEYCDCGPECDCGDDFAINEEGDQNGFSCCSGSGCFLRRNFFGILIFLLGVFYLGKNMGWWNFSLDWSLFWPIILIILGLFFITKRKK